MNLAIIESYIIVNVVLVVGGRSWFSGTCDIPEWNCDTKGANVETYFELQPRMYYFCLDGKWCESALFHPNKNIDLLTVDLVLITRASHLFRCTILDFPQLKTIHGMNAKIKSIEPWTFWNLSKLEKINLSYNKIREIIYGVFSRLPVHNLDLSWNEIEYIGKGAFHDMKNLKTLNISGNYLTMFHDSYFSIKNILHENVVFPLEVLLLKQNKLYNILLYLYHFPHLKIIDLSHNEIESLLTITILSSKMSLTKLDLTDNLLQELNVQPTWKIETLSLSFNNFKKPDFLNIDSGNVRFVALDGNPWECEEYTKLLQYLQKHGIKLLKQNEAKKVFFLNELERENYPTCVVRPTRFHKEDPVSYYLSLRDTYKNRSNLECGTNYDCQSNMICKSGRCWDPCKQSICHKTEICRVNEHIFFCECPNGQLRNPNTPASRCYNVECFRDHDCGLFGKCNAQEHICIRKTAANHPLNSSPSFYGGTRNILNRQST